jgi:hypothetical protein
VRKGSENMSDQEIVDILLKFKEVLSQGWVITDVFRSVGWSIILGLAWLVDSLENITDSILGLKTFFADSNISSLIAMLTPLSVILMAFSLLYTGYLLIFQKKVDREGIIVNIFLALVVIALLGEGMNKVDNFTNDAVNVLKGEKKGSLANSVIKDGIIDIGLYDLQGWKNPKMEPKNNIPQGSIRDININSYLTDGSEITKRKQLSNNGVDILTHKLDTLGDGSYGLQKLDDGNFITKITKEYYYRYTVDWFTVIATLAITAFTLLTIAIKLAKLCFELTFNYVLSTIIAPADIHSGQKTKQVIQNIVNIFLVTIMIFLSMKIYIFGTDFITGKLTGLPYLIALFAFSLGVIDGPNIVERLFGIDAGLKSGWGVLAGGYALAKGSGSAVKGISSATKSVGIKGLMGVAGVAGMAHGLRSRGQDQGEEQQKGPTPNASQGGKSKKDNTEVKNNQNTNEVIGANEKALASDEITSGGQQASSSLEQEMQQQEQKQKEQGHAGNTVQGLHEEMASKGYGDIGNRSAAINNPKSTTSESPTPQRASGAVTPTTSSVTTSSGSVSSGSISPSPDHITTDSAPVSSPASSGDSGGSISPSPGHVTTDSAPISSPASSGDLGGSISPSPSHVTTGSAPISSPANFGDSGNVERTERRETRHIGAVITDSFRNNKTVKRVQQSYEIDQNTGESLRRNIIFYRQKHRKGK